MNTKNRLQRKFSSNENRNSVSDCFCIHYLSDLTINSPCVNLQSLSHSLRFLDKHLVNDGQKVEVKSNVYGNCSHSKLEIGSVSCSVTIEWIEYKSKVDDSPRYDMLAL